MMGERYFERGGWQSSCCADSIELFLYEGEGISRYYFYSVFVSSFMVFIVMGGGRCSSFMPCLHLDIMCK